MLGLLHLTKALRIFCLVISKLYLIMLQMCLRHYKTTEEVVSALLEDRLPQSLRQLDQSLPM